MVVFDAPSNVFREIAYTPSYFNDNPATRVSSPSMPGGIDINFGVAGQCVSIGIRSRSPCARIMWRFHRILRGLAHTCFNLINGGALGE